MNPNLEKIERLLDEALQRPPEERAAFLDAACEGEEVVRREVEALLAADAKAGAFLSADPKASIPTGSLDSSGTSLEDPGTVIGRYKLLEQIGEGGFGFVYMTEQLEPVKRRVALKIIKPGMDSKQVIGRFEAERQALALMDHPNIAQIYDAGMVGSNADFPVGASAPGDAGTRAGWKTGVTGRPYFVMELVRGIPLTKFCEQQQLDLEARLKLFIQVCSAVQHAHQKGIIHRYLKPSNILVTLHGDQPVPKVIDFGIAKATQQPLTEKTVFTQFQQFLGTPAYMSPEQATLSGLDADTRSDIYSLGVLLYELLTGSPPFDTKELLSVGLDEMRRIIREKDPDRPSTRLRRTSASSSQPQLVTHHSSLATDLDLIVMKALEKDRARRYETANGLAADLKRYLNSEPVTAVAPTLVYQLTKFYQRNRTVARLAGAFGVLLLAATVFSTWEAARARREAARATSALNELRTTAPAFAAEARSLAAKEQFDEAIAKLDYAIKLRPDLPEYRVAKGDLLQCQFRLAAAAAVYREALRLKPGLARAEDSARLCDELLAAPPGKDGKLSSESLARLYLAMEQQQRPVGELMPVARRLGEEKKHLVEYWTARLDDLPISAEKPLEKRLTVREDGLLALDLSDTRIADLTPLVGMPLGSLNLTNCSEITDFAPLHELRSLTELNLQDTAITNLAPLNGLPLESLDLADTQIFDLTTLRGMKLKSLVLSLTRVFDLSPLRGMPLTFLEADNIPASDYSPLAGAPLEECYIQGSPLRDLSFLRNCPLQQLGLNGCFEARGYAALDGLKSLNLLILPNNFRNLPPEDLAAIAALRNNTELKNIDTNEHRTGRFWSYNTAQSAKDFWKEWDSWYPLTTTLARGGFKLSLSQLPDGKYRLTVTDQPLSDLSFLKDAPIEELIITGTRVSDLRPLEQLALTRLDIRQTPVTDLSPLRAPVLSANLRDLGLWQIPATNFSPIAACTNLEVLDAADTALADLAVVRGFKLKRALLSGCRVTDISTLSGMPLERVTLNGTGVTDISPLLQCPTLQDLTLPVGATDVKALHALPLLAKLSMTQNSGGGGYADQAASDFWKEYEHGDFNATTVLKRRLTQWNPQDTVGSMQLAFALAWSGQTNEHEAFCRRILDHAVNTKDASSAERAAKSYLVKPGSDPKLLKQAVTLAERSWALGKDGQYQLWYQMCLGLARYREKDYAGALDILSQPITASEPYFKGPSLMIQAMALHQLGRTDEARKSFQTGESLMNQPPPAGNLTMRVLTDHDGDFFWLLHAEAKALIEGRTASQ